MPPYDPQRFFDLADIGSDVRRGESARGAGLGGLDYMQLGLAGVGFTPGPVGIGADLLDAGISALRGDWLGMGLGLGAAVPGLGMGMAGRHAGKLVGQGVAGADEIAAARKALGLPEDTAEQGLMAWNRLSPEEQVRLMTPEHKFGLDLIGNPEQMRPNRQVGYPSSPEDQLIQDINDPFRISGAVTEEEKIAALQDFIEEAGAAQALEKMQEFRSASKLNTPSGAIDVDESTFNRIKKSVYEDKSGLFEFEVAGGIPRVAIEPEISRFTPRTGYGETPEQMFLTEKGRVKSELGEAAEQARIVDELAEGSDTARRNLIESVHGRGRVKSAQEQAMIESGMIEPGRGQMPGMVEGYRVGNLEYDPIFDRFNVIDEGPKTVLVREADELVEGVVGAEGRMAKRMRKETKGRPITRNTRPLRLASKESKVSPLDTGEEIESATKHLSEHESGVGGRGKLYEQQVDPRAPGIERSEEAQELYVKGLNEKMASEANAPGLEFGIPNHGGDVIRVKNLDGAGEINISISHAFSDGKTTKYMASPSLSYEDYVSIMEHGAFSPDALPRRFAFDAAFKTVRSEIKNTGTMQYYAKRVSGEGGKAKTVHYLVPPVVAKMLRSQKDTLTGANLNELFEGMNYRTLDAIAKSIISSERAAFPNVVNTAEDLLSVKGIIPNFKMTQAEYDAYKKAGKFSGDFEKKITSAKRTLEILAGHMAEKEIIFKNIGELEHQTASLWGKSVKAKEGLDQATKDTMAQAISELTLKNRAAPSGTLTSEKRIHELLSLRGVSREELPVAIEITKQAVQRMATNASDVMEAAARKTQEFAKAIDDQVGVAPLGLTTPGRVPTVKLGSLDLHRRTKSPHQMSSTEYVEEFTDLNKRTSSAGKGTEYKDLSPDEQELVGGGDWEAFSRLRGYTDEQIEEYRRFLELAPSRFPEEYATNMEMHRELVEKALSEGKNVPGKVLGEYPDLKGPTKKRKTSKKRTLPKKKKK